jgi:hypothetical protein
MNSNKEQKVCYCCSIKIDINFKCKLPKCPHDICESCYNNIFIKLDENKNVNYCQNYNGDNYNYAYDQDGDRIPQLSTEITCKNINFKQNPYYFQYNHNYYCQKCLVDSVLNEPALSCKSCSYNTNCVICRHVYRHKIHIFDKYLKQIVNHNTIIFDSYIHCKYCDHCLKNHVCESCDDYIFKTKIITNYKTNEQNSLCGGCIYNLYDELYDERISFIKYTFNKFLNKDVINIILNY